MVTDPLPGARWSNGIEATDYVPAESYHTGQEHVVVLIRSNRDFGAVQDRKQARSKYGAKKGAW